MKRLVTVAIAIGLNACSMTTAPSFDTIAQGEYSGMAWRSDRELVVAREASDADGLPYSELVLVPVDEQGVSELGLPDDSDCPGHDDFRPTRLIDGTIGFVRTCNGDSRILIMRLTDDGAEYLLDLDANPSQFDYAVDDDIGTYSHSSGICAGLRDFTTAGPEPIDTEVGAGANRFELDAMFEAPEWPGGCGATGRANMPAWRPGSDRADVAFVASPESVGVTVGRLDIPWRLYVQTGDDEPREILAGLVDPGVLAWSSDGETLALTATVDGQGTGVYLIKGDGTGMRKVSGERAASLAWSPDGSHLAILVGVPGDNVFLQDLVIVDVG